MIVYIIVALLSFFLTWAIRILAIRKSLVDVPNTRSSHTIPTPRIGGIAIILSFYIGIAILFFSDKIEKSLFLAILPGLVIASISLIDDLVGLSPWLRLVIQISCCLISLILLKGFHPLIGDKFLYVWSFFALFGMVWFVNLYNFLDGSDGYAVMEGIFVLLALLYFSQLTCLLILVLALVGFSYWNLPRAKIFMGDTGSTAIGFIIVVFGIYLNNQNSLDFSYCIVLTSLFWFDATFTLIRRTLNKEKLTQAHNKHAYQRLIQSGFSHTTILIIGFSVNLALFGICLLMKYLNIPFYYSFILALMVCFTMVLYADKRFAFR